MWIAEMETEKFSWLAAGDTRLKAREAMARGFTIHLAAVGFDGKTDAEIWKNWPLNVGCDSVTNVSEFADVLDDYYSIGLTQARSGDCFRDGALITDRRA